MAIESQLICFFIDPAETLRVKTDTSIQFMQAVQAAGYQVAYFCFDELVYENGTVKAFVHVIDCVIHDAQWWQEKEQRWVSLYDVAAVIIRKDPPFDQNYLYATYLLDLVVQQGVVVSNAPQGIRDANEKIFATHFAHLMVETVISSALPALKAFLNQHQSIVLKALNNRGGDEVIFLTAQHLSPDAVLKMMTHSGTRPILAQKFIPEVIAGGDKRIFLLGGTPLPFILLRTPPSGSFIANAAAGGSGTVQALSEQDRSLCAQLTSSLQNKGLDFVGIDVINGYLSEINVTSATCLIPLIQETGLDLAGLWFNQIDARIKNR